MICSHALQLHSALTLLARSLQPSVYRAGARGFRTCTPLHRGTKHLDWYHRSLRQEEFDRARGPALAPFPLETIHGRPRARCFLDFQFGVVGEQLQQQPAAGAASAAQTAAPGTQAHRVVFELADDIVPITAGNFLALCGAQQGYVGSPIFRAQRGFAVFGGDWEKGTGRGGHSSFSARYFPDENFIGRHTAPGVLAMATSGVHSNASAFYITLAPAPHLGEPLVYSHAPLLQKARLPYITNFPSFLPFLCWGILLPLDGRCVVFGRVLTGLDIVTRISTAISVNLRPSPPIVIKAAGGIAAGTPEWAAVDKELRQASTKTTTSAPKGGSAQPTKVAPFASSPKRPAAVAP